MDIFRRIFTPSKEITMKTTKRFLTAAISMALAFAFFGCSPDDGDDGDGGGSTDSSSSIARGSGSSSSSGGGRSSSSSGEFENCSEAIVQHNCDPNETVTIGSQIWLKCNLNVPHNSGNGNSRCYEGDDWFYGCKLNGDQGCAKYGRIYDWAAAMNLPSKCNSALSTSDSDCAISHKHRGICPQGFHIPTNAEWDALYLYVDAEYSDNGKYWSETAGSKLKAASGWLSMGWNSSDEFGFSALPGGLCNFSRDICDFAGMNGGWWSASEYEFVDIDEQFAYNRAMSNSNDWAVWQQRSKYYGLSVRCIKDN
jgi:uncharacterized protein (TIGR02145 family)